MEKRGGTDIKESTMIGTFHFWDDNIPGWRYITQEQEQPFKLSDDYHVYEVEWTETSFNFKIDGTSYHTADISDPIYDEFREEFYILLNVAVGGGFDPINAETVFPQNMFVDWVRVYTQN